MKIVVGDKKIENAQAIAKTMNEAGFDVEPTEELLSIDFSQPENIRDTLHAYQLAKHCNEKRVMARAVEWGKQGARLSDIAPGIIVTPLALDEFNGSRGDFYKNMFAKCPAGRPGTADEVTNVAELLMSDKGAFTIGFTDQISFYMDAADCFVTRTGGISITEALVKGALPSAPNKRYVL